MNKFLGMVPILLLVMFTKSFSQPPVQNKNWRLVWQDNFNSTDSLDTNWDFQNGPSRKLECSRWRENASLKGGILRLENRKEDRAGQHFTAASLWTKKKFQYGYFECRYRYAGATGTNNAFWIMPHDSSKFEIDINEGHYPNEITTNIHHGEPKSADSKVIRLGEVSEPEINLNLDKLVWTNKLRLISTDSYHISVSEVAIYSGGENVSLKARATGSSILRQGFEPINAIDGQMETRWVSAETSPDTLTIILDKPYPINEVKIHSGYKSGNSFKNVLNNYTVQYAKENKWVDILTRKQKLIYDLSRDFHTYGLLWNEKELIWYFDDKEIRREVNALCNGRANIWLSSAIASWAGPVSEKINGTSMQVDYVRYYKQKE